MAAAAAAKSELGECVFRLGKALRVGRFPALAFLEAFRACTTPLVPRLRLEAVSFPRRRFFFVVVVVVDEDKSELPTRVVASVFKRGSNKRGDMILLVGAPALVVVTTEYSAKASKQVLASEIPRTAEASG